MPLIVRLDPENRVRVKTDNLRDCGRIRQKSAQNRQKSPRRWGALPPTTPRTASTVGTLRGRGSPPLQYNARLSGKGVGSNPDARLSGRVWVRTSIYPAASTSSVAHPSDDECSSCAPAVKPGQRRPDWAAPAAGRFPDPFIRKIDKITPLPPRASAGHSADTSRSENLQNRGTFLPYFYG